jgi:hypothetical protein
MTREQESRLSMYLAAALFCDNNATLTATLPNFTANLTTLKSTITQIQSIGEQQKFDKTGVTESKSQLKATLITLASDNARKLKAFAKFTNNITLYAEVNFTASDFQRYSDTALKDYAQIVYDRAQANVAALGTYGITAATQTTLLNAINTYNAAIATPRVGTAVKSQATKQLVMLFDTANTAIANMDAAVEIIRLTQTNFYNGYRTARKMVSTGSSSLMVKGFVTDAQTGEPIRGVTITFSPNGEDEAQKSTANNLKTSKDEILLTKRTAKKGGFKVKSITEGVYKVTIAKNGYKEQVVTLAITDGEMSDLNIELEKA